jgi:SAM-dependent methyltransferase
MAEGASAQLGWYEWRAEQLRDRLTRLGLAESVAPAVRVLEVGGGPIGVATFYPGSRKLSVDPLQDYYAGNEVLRALRSPSMEYRTGVGEDLPCEDEEFDMAMIENCIDHVQKVDGVMSELHRSLRPGGILYLTVNCRNPVGYYVHRVLSRLRIDPGHPHTFTPDRTTALLRRHGFEVLDVAVGSYEKARTEDLESEHSRARWKARLGVSEFVTSVVARRE